MTLLVRVHGCYSTGRMDSGCFNTQRPWLFSHLLAQRQDTICSTARPQKGGSAGQTP